ncbi:hypothetical protein CUJ83_07005 [Methanocella sp. CWC-04]|uniref:Uncharacterized protein n=2 Tax=Methanooceanicella nereidis TaxID=2052831 RepID=A0AAP2W754_9EURY|nr:hypothetical protein [Methanocella sp. CWC-04]
MMLPKINEIKLIATIKNVLSNIPVRIKYTLLLFTATRVMLTAIGLMSHLTLAKKLYGVRLAEHVRCVGQRMVSGYCRERLFGDTPMKSTCPTMRFSLYVLC